MKVLVPLHSDPAIGEKITLYENGKERTYLVAKKVPNNSEVLYILPDDFPVCMVKVLFGAEARIEKPPKRRKKWQTKITVEA